MAVSVMIVEDEILQAQDMQSTLEGNGYEVRGVVSTSEGAVRLANAERPNVIIMDLMLLGSSNGIEAALRLRKIYDFGLIFVTGNIHSYEALESMRALKPNAMIAKPVDPQVLLNSVLRASRLGEKAGS